MISQTTLRRLAQCGFVAMLHGCTTLHTYSPVVGSNELPAPGDTFLYGSFQFNDNISMPAGANLGVTIACSDGNVYSIRFTHTQATKAIRIRPAVCSFSEMVYGSSKNIKKDAYSLGFIQRVDAREGGAYYIGSYMGQVENRPNSANLIRFYIQDLSAFSASFDNTTKAFREQYPALRDVPAYNPKQ